jgi:hypothetical protein
VQKEEKFIAKVTAKTNEAHGRTATLRITTAAELKSAITERYTKRSVTTF